MSYPSMRIWHWLDLYSPALIGLLFLILMGYELSKANSTARRQYRGRQRKTIVGLSSALTLTFVARFFERLFNAQDAARSNISHALSSILIWSSLVFIASFSDEIPAMPFLSTYVVSFLVEVTLSGSQFGLSRSVDYLRPPPFQGTLQIISAVELLALICLGIFSTSSKPAHDDEEDDETSPLLDDIDVPARKSYDSDSDRSVDTADVSASSTFIGDDEEEDDTELREARDRKIREAGGWTGYLKSFKVFLPYFRLRTLALKFYLVVIIVLTLAVRVTHILHPMQLGIIIDKLTATHQIPWFNVALWGTLGLINSGAGFHSIIDVLITRINNEVGAQIKLAGFEKIMSLSMNFHDSKESGEVIKAVEQADALASLSNVFVLEIAPAILDVFTSMWYVSHLLDFYAVHIVGAIIVAFGVSTAVISKWTSAARRSETIREREESKLFYETIGNWSTVSYFNRKTHEIKRLAHVIREVARAAIHSNDVYSVLYLVQEGAEILGSISVSILAMHRVTTGVTSVGTFVNVLNYWETVTYPLYTIASSYRQISANMISAERLIQLFDTEISVKNKPCVTPMNITQGKVEFSDVDFAYEGRETIINKLNFTVEAGQTAAFVGETGSGKSTLLKLLMRFYDINSGQITIDGQDIANVTLDSLRKIFGIVPQDSVLFNTTILENVRYGRLDASDEEVYEACRAACIHDKIMSFPKGYGSKCGERGIKLSGGERQRIAIARVILKQPQIILLDEATSAMDSQIESKIQTALGSLMKGRTAFVIAHRLSTIVDADVIFVMDAGRILERGTHEELMGQRGRYYSLWTKQSTSKSEREKNGQA